MCIKRRVYDFFPISSTNHRLDSSHNFRVIYKLLISIFFQNVFGFVFSVSCGEISHQNTRLFLYCSGVPFFRLRTFYSHYNFDMIIMTLLRWPCSPFTSILLAANFSFTLFIHKYGIPRVRIPIGSVCENEAERRKKPRNVLFFSFSALIEPVRLLKFMVRVHFNVNMTHTNEQPTNPANQPCAV